MKNTIYNNMKFRAMVVIDRFMREARGVAAVEFAFIAPIMLLLFVGTIELSAGISVNRKLSRLSSTISDLVTQSQTLTSNDVANILDAASHVMYPYDEADVDIILTLVEIESGQAKVVTSCSRPSGKGYATGSLYTVPAKIKKDGTKLITAQVSTNYKPAFGWARYSEAEGVSFDNTAIPMEEEIFLRPRIGSSVDFSC